MINNMPQKWFSFSCSHKFWQIKNNFKKIPVALDVFKSEEIVNSILCYKGGK